jgi:hypothetical protein
MKSGTIILLTLLVIVTCLGQTSSAYELSKPHVQFLLGVGLGTGLTSFTQTIKGENVDYSGDNKRKFALATDFRIGFKYLQTAIYLTNKVSWFRMTNVLRNKVIVANGSTEIGFLYSFRRAAPSYFLTSGFGSASWILPFERDSRIWMGFSFYFGAGYEFIKHFSAEFDIVRGTPHLMESGVKGSTHALNIIITLNALAY